MLPSSAKAKGRKVQQWTRDLILRLFLSLGPGDVVSTSMGCFGEDIQFSQAGMALGISVECKARAKASVYDFVDQAARNARGREPVVVLKADRRRPLAVVDAEFFFGVLAARRL